MKSISALWWHTMLTSKLNYTELPIKQSQIKSSLNPVYYTEDKTSKCSSKNAVLLRSLVSQHPFIRRKWTEPNSQTVSMDDKPPHLASLGTLQRTELGPSAIQSAPPAGRVPSRPGSAWGPWRWEPRASAPCSPPACAPADTLCRSQSSGSRYSVSEECVCSKTEQRAISDHAALACFIIHTIFRQVQSNSFVYKSYYFNGV